MAILSKIRKPDNFESLNSPKLRFTNIRAFFSNFVGCESSPESNSSVHFALCGANLKNSTASNNYFVWSYLFLI